MNHSDIDDRPDLNTGKERSEMDLFDLSNSIRLDQPIEEIASFLCRSRREEQFEGNLHSLQAAPTPLFYAVNPRPKSLCFVKGRAPRG